MRLKGKKRKERKEKKEQLYAIEKEFNDKQKKEVSANYWQLWAIACW